MSFKDMFKGPRRGLKSIVLCVLAVVGLTAADLQSKRWAENAISKERTAKQYPVCKPAGDGYVRIQRLPSGSVVLIEDYLEFRYAENCGAAFGFLRDAPVWLKGIVFNGAGIIAIFVLIGLFIFGKGGTPFAISVPMILSGAIGNMTDRWTLGYVVDFIRFHIENKWEWPTFNVADICITVGVFLILIDGMIEGKKQRRAELDTQQ